MLGALAIGVLAGLLSGVALDAEVGASSEVRVRSITATGLPRQNKPSLVAIPSATGIVEGLGLRSTLAYAPRLWTGDLTEDPSLLVNHVVSGTVVTRVDAPWRAEGAVDATRGVADLFADPLRAARRDAQPAQLTTVRPVKYDELVAGARCEIPAGDRTILFGAVGWNGVRPVSREDRVHVPQQRRVSADAQVLRLVTERDTLRLDGGGRRVDTRGVDGLHTADVLSAGASWRRVLSTRYQGWIGAGATLARSGEPPDPGRWTRLPRGELGFAYGGEGVPVQGDVTARITTFVDRFNSEVKPMADGIASVRWLLRDPLSLSASAFAASRLDGETTITGADLRLSWTAAPQVVVETGLLVRAQHEARPERPDFAEQTFFVVVAYNSQRLLRSVPP